jgi:hypothetical protein
MAVKPAGLRIAAVKPEGDNDGGVQRQDCRHAGHTDSRTSRISQRDILAACAGVHGRTVEKNRGRS